METKIADTWDDKVEPMMESAGMSDDATTAQAARGRSLAAALESRRERVRIDLYATAARQIWARALAERPAEVTCTQCGSLLDVPLTLVSINLTCPGCGAMTTFEPGMRARAVAHSAIPALLEEATLAQRAVLDRAQAALDASRNETPELVDDLELAQRAYWSQWLRLRNAWEGSGAEAFEADLEGRMRWFEERYRR